MATHRRNRERRERARELRVKERLSTYEIQEALGGSVLRSTIGRWLKDIPLSKDEVVSKVVSAQTEYRNSPDRLSCRPSRPPTEMPACPCGNICKDRRSEFCSSKCSYEARFESFITAWKSGLIGGSIAANDEVLSLFVRRYLFKKFDSSCVECGWNKKNAFTGKIPLEIDHIDGDPKNHLEDNLRLVCPNCHSLTQTYRALNKGHGRRNRR